MLFDRYREINAPAKPPYDISSRNGFCRRAYFAFLFVGHEHPYSIKMKHLKLANSSLLNNRSFDGDEHLYLQNQYNSSSTSLNHVSTTNYHDFELQKREKLTGLLRFFFGLNEYFFCV